MHTRHLHSFHGHYAARQLAFHTAFQAHILHKLAGAERLLFIKQFIAIRLVSLYPLGTEQHARTRDLVFAHQHLPGLRVQVVGDGFGIQYLHYISGRIAFTRTIQRAKRALVAPEVKHHTDSHQRGDTGQCHQRAARA